MEIIFETSETYRKYNNIQNNPKVSFVIGWNEKITVQYQGVSNEITGEEIKKYQEIYLTKIPSGAKFINDPKIKLFKVTPTWIRYSDLSINPWNVFEINL